MTSARYFTECKVNKKSSALLRAHNPQHSSPSAPWQFVKKQEPVHIGNYENLGCMYSNDVVPLIHVYILLCKHFLHKPLLWGSPHHRLFMVTIRLSLEIGVQNVHVKHQSAVHKCEGLQPRPTAAVLYAAVAVDWASCCEDLWLENVAAANFSLVSIYQCLTRPPPNIHSLLPRRRIVTRREV